jgi:hypothetical protein
MNHYLASQLIAQRQADVEAGVKHRAAVKAARAARKARNAPAARPVRGARFPLIRRLALSGA